MDFDASRANIDVPSGPHKAVPSLRTILVADWVSSTDLIQRLGDRLASHLFHQHDLLLERLLARTQGRLIDKADGILALFLRPVQAVEFAFRYQQGLRELGGTIRSDIQTRIGIHVGEVMLWANSPERIAQGAKPIEVEGLAKPVAARLMSLALPNQILMSGMAQTLAQRAQDELTEFGHISWQVHGRYRFKGVPAPMIVHEAGLPGKNPLRLPPSSDKAKREVPLWRQPVVLAMEGALLAGLVGFGLWSTFKSPPAIAFAERDWVVLGDVQNLTSEQSFTGSLDAAWRVGLEQSKYVNVISELQEESALQRMQRVGQSIDRKVGAELAQREDARALILPTIAEVGGRVRVSLEIIDPVSGVTVHTISADGAGRESALDAIDQVTHEMRDYLGEPLNDIKSRSMPLEQVTTKNLEALKAYSLGIQARRDARVRDAINHLERAVALDPEFAMAHAVLASSYLVGGQRGRYLQSMAEARRHEKHLTEREKLFLQASSSVESGPAQSVPRYKLMLETYPDDYRAAYNYAYFSYWDGQDCITAAPALEASIVSRNPAAKNAAYMHGVMMLCQNQVDAALKSFQNAERLGVKGYRLQHILALLLANDTERARAVAQNQVTSELEKQDPTIIETNAFISLISGDSKEALALLDSIYKTSKAEGRTDACNFLAGRVLLLSEINKKKAMDENKLLVDCIQSDSLADDLRHQQFLAYVSAYVAARSGDTKLYQQIIGFSDSLMSAKTFPGNSGMRTAAQVAYELSQKNFSKANELLDAGLQSPNSLIVLYHLKLELAQMSGDNLSEKELREWLGNNSGRVHAEPSFANILAGYNIYRTQRALSARQH
jgi:putative peptide modification system cyclase